MHDAHRCSVWRRHFWDHIFPYCAAETLRPERRWVADIFQTADSPWIKFRFCFGKHDIFPGLPANSKTLAGSSCVAKRFRPSMQIFWRCRKWMLFGTRSLETSWDFLRLLDTLFGSLDVRELTRLSHWIVHAFHEMLTGLAQLHVMVNCRRSLLLCSFSAVICGAKAPLSVPLELGPCWSIGRKMVLFDQLAQNEAQVLGGMEDKTLPN